MNGTRHNRNFRHLRAGGVAVLVGLALMNAAAQTQAPGMSADYWGRYTAPGMQTITMGGQGRPIVFKGSPTINAPTGGAGPLSVSRTLVLTNPSNVAYNVVARTNIPPARLAAVLRKGLAVVPVLAAGVALYDLAKELGFDPRKQDGVTVLDKPIDGYCSVAPCYGYAIRIGGIFQTFRTMVEACNSAIPAAADGFTYTVHSISGHSCTWRRSDGGFLYGTAVFVSRPVDTGPATTLGSLDDFETAVANKTTWPANSKVPLALRDAVLYEPQVFDPTTSVPTLTGPASTSGGTKTTNNPDGTTTTTTTTHNHTYNNNNISTTTVVVSSVFNPTTNTTTTTTTTSTPEASAEPIPAEDPCLKNPTRVGCQVLQEPAAEEVPTDTKNVRFNPESVAWGASASCPSPLSIGTFAGAPRQLDFTPFCDTAVKMRPFFLVAAGIVSMLIVVAALRV